MSAWLSMWSERAGRAENCADELADALAECRERFAGYVEPRLHAKVDQALASHRELVARRARPLPAGPMAAW